MNRTVIVVAAIAVVLNGCGHTTATVPPTVKNHVQPPQPMQVQKMALTNKQMLKGKRLAKRVKKQLRVAQEEAVKAGGRVHVVCPSKVPAAIMDELKAMGIGYTVDYSANSGYTVELYKNPGDATKSPGISFSETQIGK